jgi:hypothetical protein
VLLTLLFLAAAASIEASALESQQQQTGTSSSQSSPPQQPSSQAADKQSTAPKVWTNEDLEKLKGQPGVSTVGKAEAKPANQPANQGTGKGHDPAWYRRQIENLQQKVPPLHDKIQLLQAALSGKAVDSVRTWGGVRPDDWRDQLARLQKQKEDILAKVAALEDQARHSGVPPNAIP